MLTLTAQAHTAGSPLLDPGITALIQGGGSIGIITVLLMVVKVLFADFRSLNAQLLDRQREHAVAIVTSHIAHAAEIKAIRDDHDTIVATMARDHRDALERMRALYDQKLELVVAQRRDEMSAFVDASGMLGDALDRLGVSPPGPAPTPRRSSKEPRR
jgi:threonine dehydrogenase-like Zn-dependent dehydrogenase